MTETFPRLEILPPSQRRIWPELCAIPKDFVLYGGTALALHLGHRESGLRFLRRPEVRRARSRDRNPVSCWRKNHPACGGHVDCDRSAWRSGENLILWSARTVTLGTASCGKGQRAAGCIPA